MQIITKFEDFLTAHSDTHYVKLGDKYDGVYINGWVKPKNKDLCEMEHGMYLSTHTFYKKRSEDYTQIMNEKYGFNIEIKGV